MKPKRLAIALIAAVTAASSLAASAQSSRDGRGCARVSGEFAFSAFGFTGATTAAGVGVVRGDLVGTFDAEYWDVQQDANGVISTRAMHILTTANGRLVTSDRIRLLPDATPGFVRPDSRLRIIAGTRQYEGAGGLLRTGGKVNLTTLEGAITYEGTLCLGENDSDD
jgi:hypothetical protein